jgi:hypothetical protein
MACIDFTRRISHPSLFNPLVIFPTPALPSDLYLRFALQPVADSAIQPFLHFYLSSKTGHLSIT